MCIRDRWQTISSGTTARTLCTTKPEEALRRKLPPLLEKPFGSASHQASPQGGQQRGSTPNYMEVDFFGRLWGRLEGALPEVWIYRQANRHRIPHKRIMVRSATAVTNLTLTVGCCFYDPQYQVGGASSRSCARPTLQAGDQDGHRHLPALVVKLDAHA